MLYTYFKSTWDRSTVHLQWAPLRKERMLWVQNVYEDYISNSSVVMLDAFWFRCRLYARRSDGTPRATSVVSPLMFLTLESFGRKVWSHHQQFKDEHLFRFYAGNYEKDECRYKDSYCTYAQMVNDHSGFSYYVKTDIRSFYDNISIDRLMDSISTILKNEATMYSIYFYEELLKYCGYGKYPTIDNSVALSYMAVMVYLEKTDKAMLYYLKTLDNIRNFKMVRYQDDLYILFDTKNQLKNDELNKLFDEIENRYMTILSKEGLTCNLSKTEHGGAERINTVRINLSYNDELPIFEGTITADDLHKFFDKYLSSLEKCNQLLSFSD